MEPTTATIAAAVTVAAQTAELVVEPHKFGFLESLLASGLSWALGVSPHMAPIVAALAIVGSLRLVFKPLVTALKDIAKLTWWTSYDDDLLAGFEKSKVYTTICWVLDWLASVKLPGKK